MVPNQSRKSLFITTGIILIFFFAWELAVKISNTPVYLLPAPSRVIKTLFENPQTFAQATFLTLSEALIGLFIGVVAGILIASLLTLLPGIEDGVMTLAILIKSTPMVAIAPLLTLWLGFGILPKIIITALMSFFPVLINVLSGLQRVDPALSDLFRSWNASRWEIFRFLRAPSAIPYLFTALRITGPLSLIGAIVAEWTGASGGLGRTMWMAYTNLNLPFLFAAIFILAAAGMIIYRTITWFELKAVFWQSIQENS
ncbi:MAG TPA: ABC transporter permease [Anaerolineaceae bacterium]|nr:ABC transporter permease [Anaerolineaceae bacterium]